MNKTRFAVPKMDCAAEERLVRIALEGRAGVHRIQADLGARQLVVVHEGDATAIAAVVRPLNLGAEILETTEAPELDEVEPPSSVEETRALKIVLAINAAMFAGEAIGAWMADSSALLADSLDMFADAAVYAIALFGVHRAQATQLKAAHVSGVLQLLLAAGALAEVLRRGCLEASPRLRSWSWWHSPR